MILESLVLVQLATPCRANDLECQALFNERVVTIPAPQMQPPCWEGYKWQFTSEVVPPSTRPIYKARCVPK